nr:hypothetical protein [Aeromicrobium wangtongii]
MLIAAGAGYVLGTRAGRERYEQIKSQATQMWHNPKVQDVVDDVQTQAKHAAGDVKNTVSDKVSSSSDDSSQSSTFTTGQGTA